MIPLKIILCYNLQQHYPHRRHPRHLTPPLRVILPQIVPHPTSTPHLFPNFAGKVSMIFRATYTGEDAYWFVPFLNISPNTFTASSCEDIRTSAYRCVVFTLECPSSLLTVKRSVPAASRSVANVARLVWKQMFFFIPARFASALTHTLQVVRSGKSNTFSLSALPSLRGSHLRALLLRGTTRGFHVFCIYLRLISRPPSLLLRMSFHSRAIRSLRRSPVKQQNMNPTLVR